MRSRREGVSTLRLTCRRGGVAVLVCCTFRPAACNSERSSAVWGRRMMISSEAAATVARLAAMKDLVFFVSDGIGGRGTLGGGEGAWATDTGLEAGSEALMILVLGEAAM